MTVSIDTNPTIAPGGTTLLLSQLISVTSSGSNPAYLVLNGFDRAEYTAGASGQTGVFSGNGHTVALSYSNGDARENGIVFTYQTNPGRYFNGTVGYLDQLTFTTSTSRGDITDLSLFGFSPLSLAKAQATYPDCASDAYYLMSRESAGFLGSTTLATLPTFAGPVPAQATPNAIAAIADGFVGQSWNMDGCWVLTSTIAAEAGASLPIQSTMEIAGQASGEWFVAYNGPAGSSGNWQSMVHTGDMIGFITGSGGGHITTCVAGSGSTAQLVDNITYVDGSGNVLNAANDGSAADVIVAAPHAASQEWAGVAASSVVIYRLDTPIVTALAAPLTLAGGASEALAAAFSAADPAGRGITQYQAYLGSVSDALAVNGAITAAFSAASAATANSLDQLVLARGAAGGTDTVTLRAFNGLYWGDWTTLTVTGSAGTGPSTTTAPVTEAPLSPGSASSTTTPVYRFFERTDGTHFYTASQTEANALIASRPDLSYEGLGLNALATTSGDAAAEPVFRFFDTSNDTHFYTASTSEQAALATRPGFGFEGVAFYEHAAQQQGDIPVYRFFDTAHGTHLFTDSASERTSILATRPDLVSEGIAFYAPT